jgi:hypothetical protein
MFRARQRFRRTTAVDFAWTQWQRRLLMRWEHYPANFLDFVQLAVRCILPEQF